MRYIYVHSLVNFISHFDAYKFNFDDISLSKFSMLGTF